MPDIKIRISGDYFKKYVDMSDGTHAEAVFPLNAGSAVSAAALGDPADPAWNGTDPEATLISIMKA